MWIYTTADMEIKDDKLIVNVNYTDGSRTIQKSHTFQLYTTTNEINEYLENELTKYNTLLYLCSSKFEGDQVARIQGINCETYIYKCNLLGNPHYPHCRTMYCFEMITHPLTNESALEIDITSDYYTLLPQVHRAKLIDRANMEYARWFNQEELLCH